MSGAKSAFDELFASLPAALQKHMNGKAGATRAKLTRDVKPRKPKGTDWRAIAKEQLGVRHIPLSLAERRLVERAAAILEKEPAIYARGALIAQSRAVVELHAHGHFKAAKERG